MQAGEKVPKYKYEARTLNGEKKNGVMESDSKDGVIMALREQQMFPIKVIEESIANKEIKFSFKVGKVKARDLAVFCRQFQTVLSAGISVVEALDILRKQTENRIFKEHLDQVFQEVQKGQTLSSVMEKHPKAFPDLLINMVRAGETSGLLDQIMDRMAVHYDKEQKINKKVTGALAYPMLITVVAFGVCFILVNFVLPKFVVMLEGLGTEIPLPTKVLLASGDFSRKYWYLIVGSILLAGYFLMRFLKSDEGNLWFDGFKLRAPILGNMFQKVITSRFSRTLSTMLLSGIPIIEAMELSSKVVGNAFVTMRIDSIMDKIRKGDGIASPVASLEIFPPMMTSMLKVGEETGAIDNMLEEVATFYDSEVDVAIEQSVKMIEPLIIIVMAVVVGGIVLSVALPMFKMYDNLQF